MHDDRHLYRDSRKKHNVVRLPHRILRDESVFNDYITGVPVTKLVDRYDLSWNALHKAVHRHALRTGANIPATRVLTERRRLWRREQDHLHRLEILKGIDLEELDDKEQRYIINEITYREIFLAWRRGKSFTWLSGRYSLPEVSIKSIVRRMSKPARGL